MSPGATWGHFLSCCHLLLAKRDWHLPSYNLFSGSCRDQSCYIIMNICMSSFLIACILAVGENWPYLQYFWKNSICLSIWPAASGICKLSPASSLVAVSPVCYGGWWPAAGPTSGSEPSNQKPCCRKGRRAQAAGVRGPQQDYGLLPSSDSPCSKRQAASLAKQCFHVTSIALSGCQLRQMADFLR